MAKVKFPLFSLSASGSIGRTITYNKCANQQARRILRQRDGTQFVAEYPSRALSGLSVARKMPNRLNRRRLMSEDALVPIAPGPARQRAIFALGIRVSAWLVIHNIGVARRNPDESGLLLRPWWNDFYTQQSISYEERKFPGQPEGETLQIRRQFLGTQTPQSYIFRQIVARGNVRFETFLRTWLNTDIEIWRRLAPEGNAPYEGLPYLRAFGIADDLRALFVNTWLWRSYLINRFTFPKGGVAGPPFYGLWTNTTDLPPDAPEIIAYDQRLSVEREYEQIPVEQWSRENRA